MDKPVVELHESLSRISPWPMVAKIAERQLVEHGLAERGVTVLIRRASELERDIAGDPDECLALRTGHHFEFVFDPNQVRGLDLEALEEWVSIAITGIIDEALNS